MIDRIRRSEEPVPPEPEPTVADLADRFMKACRGELPAQDRRDPRGDRQAPRGAAAWHAGDLRGRAVAHRGAARQDARDALPGQPHGGHDRQDVQPGRGLGLVPPDRNPCRSVRRYRERPRERFLSTEEYRRLGAALDAAEADGSVIASAIAAIRLLLLTGCRKMEIVRLRCVNLQSRLTHLVCLAARRSARCAVHTVTMARHEG